MQFIEIEDAKNHKVKLDKGLEVPHQRQLKTCWERPVPSTGQVYESIHSE